jgi:hypothetical protein
VLQKATITLVVLLSAASLAFAENEPADDLAHAITNFFWNNNPAVSGHGLALDDGERYHHSITVQWTGKKGDSVETQVRTSAEVAMRVGHFVLDKGFRPPGEHLIIKMALMKPDQGFINTFSVRYRWADVLTLDKGHAKISELAAKGMIETIWHEYWPTMCLNPPPRELFGDYPEVPMLPEDVENPTGKDLSCHRKR